MFGIAVRGVGTGCVLTERARQVMRLLGWIVFFLLFSAVVVGLLTLIQHTSY